VNSAEAKVVNIIVNDFSLFSVQLVQWADDYNEVLLLYFTLIGQMRRNTPYSIDSVYSYILKKGTIFDGSCVHSSHGTGSMQHAN